jgi:DNA-binding GntR family transcriptional regulator
MLSAAAVGGVPRHTAVRDAPDAPLQSTAQRGLHVQQDGTAIDRAQTSSEHFEGGGGGGGGVKSDILALPQQRSLHDIVAERLVAAIQAGEMKPGERLVEVTLASRMGVSRAPLREALKLLEAQGIVEARRGRGTFVRAISDAQIADMLAMRAMLEGFAARQCAARASDSELAVLAGLHRQLEFAHASGDRRMIRALDWRFHETVCQFSGNDYLLDSWRSLAKLLKVFGSDAEVAPEAEVAELHNHRAYLTALQSRNVERAEHVFRSTILSSGYESLGRTVPPSLAPFV